MITLGIESTCDETAAALIDQNETILSNVIFSQSAYHEQFGGVFPEMASRLHIEQMIPTIEAALQGKKPDLIAVANRPGLLGGLLMGIVTAEALSYAWNIPHIGVDHVEAHLYSSMMEAPRLFPSLGLILSGGHTVLVKITSINEYQVLGKTVDDAIGESFDKVAAMLGLQYPGGPLIEKLAVEGDPFRYPFKGGSVKGSPLNFSFSGLKTNVLYTIQGQKGEKIPPSLQEKKDIAASFQRAAIDDVYDKALLAASQFDCQAIYLGGGVTCNSALKNKFKNSPYPSFFPRQGLECDNAAMIAGLGMHLFFKGGAHEILEAYPRML
ncbi:MAG: tRNA (adenosine(37)-N6)-threonylcarbamoyltransferase complex transferase subunit TsaD [Simkaniaceae bacterium]|nr:tRNA (adenosine(37)-N6)-threonylcarbamoyltransferase complex transferase subunit TsaD [Simkaniaceae bacterium]